MNEQLQIPERTAEPIEVSDRREFLKRIAAGGGGLLLWTLPKLQVKAMGTGEVGAAAAATGGAAAAEYDWTKHYWAYAVDTNKCIGCNSCVRACRAENQVPEGQHRTWVERYEIGDDGEVHVDVAHNEGMTFDENVTQADRKGKAPLKAFFVPKLCNHCEKTVCTQVCPVGASFTTKDGVVLVDKDHCIGCGYCVQACPYASRFINKETHTADKCSLCYHRITKGMLPACVEVCPNGARIFGDLKDPKSDISRLLRERRYTLLKPDLGTHPKCYYIGIDQEVH
jgi:Fe-S-cluster-containing dehydrogenase component